MVTTRKHLHELVDAIPADKLDDVARYIEQIAETHRPTLDEILANAPYDDEPLTPEEEAAIARGRADVAAGRVHSHADVMRELGIHDA